MMVANIRKIWTVCKKATQKFYGEIFNLRKTNELEVWKQYQIEVTNRFIALENLFDDEYINRYWYNIKENVKISTNKNLDLHELSNINNGLMKNVLVFRSKEAA